MDLESGVSLGAAAALLGVSGPTMRKLIRRNGIVLGNDPFDERKKIMARVDLASLIEMRNGENADEPKPTTSA